MAMEDIAARSERLDRFQRRRRLALGLLLTAIFFCLLFVRTFETGDEGLHEFVENVGIAAILFAILGRMWCTLYIGGRKNAEIVRGGPYSISRNPLYFFSTVGAMGIGAMIGSVTVALFLGLVCCAAFHYVIRVEEEHLKQVFGEPYRKYLEEVPRFFPDPRLFGDINSVSVRPDRLYRTFGDGVLFLAAYPLFETVEYLQDMGVLPVLLHVF